MTLESVVEGRLLLRVQQCGGLCLKMSPAAWVGVPDRLVLLPGGRAAFAELKRPEGGRTTRRQEYVHGVLRQLGFRVDVLASVAAVDAWVAEVAA